MIVDGQVRAKANNIASDLNVIYVNSTSDFNEAAANQPFNSTSPLPPQETLSSAASKARYAAKASDKHEHLVFRANELAPADQGLR